MKVLFEIFGNKVNSFAYLSNYKSNGTYIPDYIIFDENLCFDIEIDEPYTLKEKKAIHYIGCNNERDIFFTSNNWCVIRFSESQILSEPYECCKFIVDTYSKLTGQPIGNHTKLKLRNHPTKMNRWDLSRANEMTSVKHREQNLQRAKLLATQKEYFPRNYFLKDNYILLTNTGIEPVAYIRGSILGVPKKDNYEPNYCCLSSGILGVDLIRLNYSLFPNLELGDTIQINTNLYELEYSTITIISAYGGEYEEKRLTIKKCNPI